MAKDTSKIIDLDFSGDDTLSVFGLDEDETEEIVDEMHEMAHDRLEPTYSKEEDGLYLDKREMYKVVAKVLGNRELSATEAMFWGWVSRDIYEHVGDVLSGKIEENKKSSKSKGSIIGKMTIETNSKNMDKKLKKALANLIKELED